MNYSPWPHSKKYCVVAQNANIVEIAYEITLDGVLKTDFLVPVINDDIVLPPNLQEDILILLKIF